MLHVLAEVLGSLSKDATALDETAPCEADTNEEDPASPPHRQGLRCTAASRNNVLRFIAMTICLCHGGICEFNIRCSWPRHEQHGLRRL